MFRKDNEWNAEEFPARVSARCLIPAAAGLHRDGASKPSTMAFTVSNITFRHYQITIEQILKMVHGIKTILINLKKFVSVLLSPIC
jgi:hypothetical protein